MEIIWTPWRYEYVSNVDRQGDCIFCDKTAEGCDRENQILKRAKRCVVMLNRYPYTTGHLMIAPFEHLASIEDLDGETAAEMMALAQLSIAALRKSFGPDGFNIGINIARVAGAGLADHVHMHVVPRWAGDNNFMAVVADTKVLPCNLDDVYDRLEGLI